MNILLVDDDVLVTTALKTILETDSAICVTGTGCCGQDAIRLYRELQPDILLMDIRMKNMDGLEAAQEILLEFPQGKILLLTTFADDEYLVRSLKIGTKGYLLKQDYANLIPAIHAVYSGQTVLGSEVVNRLPELLQKENAVDGKKYGLTEKELEIVRAVANGLSNREIADALFLSEGTVRNYLSAVLEKLTLRDRTQLAIYYYKHMAQENNDYENIG